MGLDISVCRLKKPNEDEKKKYYCFRMVDEDGNYNDKGFPKWTKEFETEMNESWYDWEKYKEESGIDINDNIIDEHTFTKDGNYIKVHPKNKILPTWSGDYVGGWDAYQSDCDKIQIKIDLDKVPTKLVTIKVIYYKEIGYQRKGLNSDFYKDYRDGKIGYFVWSKSELERYKHDYCDESYIKNDFQKNIINEFEDGKDCVTFDW